MRLIMKLRNAFITILLAGMSAALLIANGSKQILHYAYYHPGPDGEQMMQNWNGTIIWNTHPSRSELWVQTGGKTLLILDKSVLEAMQKATDPLRHSTASNSKQREAELNGVYAKTNKIVTEAIAKGLGTPAKP